MVRRWSAKPVFLLGSNPALVSGVEMAKTFCIGDIHGSRKALVQCLERAEFNVEEDMLICLGDVCDGGPEVRQCFDILLSLKNLIYIRGNHDQWALDWMHCIRAERLWIKQGGARTMESYGNCPSGVPKHHVELLEKSPFYYKDDKNRVFVHGGFTTGYPIEMTKDMDKMWDRDLFFEAYERDRYAGYHKKPKKITEYERVFIGHTSTLVKDSLVPMKCCEVWNLDTGAGWPTGLLTIMNVDTEEYWQSDFVRDLYPGDRGRM